MKIWIKISSENRLQGAWFYNLQDARDCAATWEDVIPVEIDLQNGPNDALHIMGKHRVGDNPQLIPDLIEEAYQTGLREGKK